MGEQQLQRGRDWLETLLQAAGFPAQVTTELKLASDQLQQPEGCWLTINHADLSPSQIDILVGPSGAVIDSLQYLANAILNLGQNQDQQAAYTIELNGYRDRRYAELQAMAMDAAEQVRRTGEEYEMPPLSSAERRWIHTIFQEFTDLETYSRGQEPERRLVVRPGQAEDSSP